jgi:type I restriction enzyme S subunit
MDGLDFQEIKKSELENEFTIGAEYYGKKYVESISVVKRQKKTIPLGQMWILATDGDHGSPDYQESGVLYLLSECVKEGYIEKAKCRYITEAKNRELKRSCLHPGDIVVTKTGVYFGKSAVIPESIPEANTIAHVGKITLKSQYNPYYVSTFLNCKYGYCQLRRRGIKATRPEIKLVEFPDIVIPEFSDRLYSAVEASVRKANTLLELASGTMELSAKLIIDSLAVGSSYAERVSKALVSFKNSFQLTGRLDAEYYQLKYKNYEAAVFGASNGYTFVKNEFVPVKKSCPRTLDNYNYVEIGDIDVGTGSAFANTVATEELPDNAKIMTQKGDLLVSTVRPNRGAVAILGNGDLLVSGAFTVLREDGDYPKEVLQVLLRTSMYRDWLLRFNVGTSYPVIKDEDVLNMPIPILGDDIKQDVVAKVNESASLRRQSKQLLEYAKQAVEMAIEQGEDIALAWLKSKVEQ